LTGSYRDSMSMSCTAASLGGTYHDMRHDLMLTTARQGKQRRGRGQLPGLRSPDHVDTQPQVRVRVRRIHPGPGVIPDPQVPQRRRQPGDLVARGEPAAAATWLQAALFGCPALGFGPTSLAGYGRVRRPSPPALLHALMAAP
jgi:hypothetical protein